MRFIRSWIERPLAIGAVTPSGRILARAMARYVDPNSAGPVVELGPGPGPVTEALVEAGVAPSRLVLVEFNPAFCRILRSRYPDATLVQGDAYSLRRLLATLLLQPAAAVVSGLPLVTKPIRMRLRLDPRRLRSHGARRALRAVHLLGGGAVAEAASAAFLSVEASERIWMNLPPARVWVYRRTDDRGQMTDRPLFSHPSSVVRRHVVRSWLSPKILVIPGSLRTGSHNARLAALAAKELALAEAEVTRISLADYPLPLFDADLVADGRPPAMRSSSSGCWRRTRVFSSPAPNTAPR